MWRPEDEALLLRLTDEALLESLWRARICRRAPPPHPRAAGVISLLRRTAAGAEAVERAVKGELGPLARLLVPRPGLAASPAMLHHLALLHGQAADALAASDAGRALEARMHALVAWLALGEEGSYLRRLAAAVVAGALPDEEVERAAAEAPLAAIDALGAAAVSGAPERTAAGRIAMRALARVPEACARAAVSATLAGLAARRAETLRARAIAEALAPIEAAYADAAARTVAAPGRAAVLHGAIEVWEWADRPEDVERFAVDQATPLLWELYRDRRFIELRSAIEPFLPLVASLSRRIERDPAGLAYAAPCAQMYVFLADVQETLEQQIEICERAVKICPTHRNGRVVLAELLCERALDVLAQGFLLPDAADRAAADIDRAAQLYPDAKRLPRARDRLAKTRGRR